MNQNDDEMLFAVFYVSRNKDNKDVVGFKERRKMFVHDSYYIALGLLDYTVAHNIATKTS